MENRLEAALFDQTLSRVEEALEGLLAAGLLGAGDGEKSHGSLAGQVLSTKPEPDSDSEYGRSPSQPVGWDALPLTPC